MNQTELGFDYSKLKTCTIYKKNFLLKMMFFILSVTFGVILITFLILYFLKVPMDFNGVKRGFDDPIYQQFFTVFLSIWGGITFVFIVMTIIPVAKKKRPYIIVDQDANLNTFYYIYDYRQHQEIYLTDDYALIYRERYGRVDKESNPEQIKQLKDFFVFWLHFPDINNAKIKHMNHKTIVKFKEKQSGRFVNYYRKYVFKDLNHTVPLIVKENVMVRIGGNYRTQSLNLFYFEDINQTPSLQMRPEIKKALSQEF